MSTGLNQNHRYPEDQANGAAILPMTESLMINGNGHFYTLSESKPLAQPESRSASRRIKNISLILIPFFVVLLILAIIGACTNSTPKSPRKVTVTEDDLLEPLNRPDQHLRLPRTVRPTHYKLDLIPYLENDTAAGSVWIHVTCVQAGVRNITLHAKNITILKLSVATVELAPTGPRGGGDSAQWRLLDVVQVSTDKQRDFYTLHLREGLTLGFSYQLHLEFVSKIRDDLQGMYKSKYVDGKTNDTKSLVVTQFEPISARLAFPCFDEPQLKATFELSIGRTANMSSISNMDRNRTESMPGAPGWVWDHYPSTPLMSTYLLAFVVSEFTHKETTFTSGDVQKPLRVWSRPDYIAQTNFALQIAPRLVNFFEFFLGTEYPMQKLDLVAVPDFGHGAMENLGMITFKEAELLLVELDSSQSTLDSVASTIAHEIAHQWFGDLVTMDWWRNVWLNEGFATYLQYIAVNYVKPPWAKMVAFQSAEVYVALQTDALATSHPISMPVDNLNEVTEMFDTITYSKGAAVIRMMAHFLTEATFQRGLQRYLQKWKFNTTTPDDIWQAMTDQGLADGTLFADMSVKQVMDGWTRQAGFPVVQVQRTYKSDDADADARVGTALLLTQTQFRATPSEASGSGQIDTSSSRWWIPISYATPSINADFSVTQPLLWLAPELEQYTTEVVLNATESETDSEWIIVNVKQTGFYRVNYDSRNWRLIAMQLRLDPNAIAVENRGQIIDDAFNLAQASMMPYELAFVLADYLQDGHEREFLPWKAYAEAMGFFSSMFATQADQLNSIHVYVRQAIQKEINRLGFIDRPVDKVPTTQTRALLMALACIAENDACVANARNLFATWMANPEKNTVPVNYRKVIYCTAIKNGGDREWNFLLARYLDHSVTADRKSMVHGLSCSKDLELLTRLVDMALDSGSGIRRGDGAHVLKEVAGANPVGSKLVVDILVEKWTEIVDYLPSVDRVLDMLGNRLNTPESLHQLETLKSKYENQIGDSAMALNEALEQIQVNIKWMQDDSDEVAQILMANTAANGAARPNAKSSSSFDDSPTEMILFQ